MQADVDCWLYAITVRAEHFPGNLGARPFLYFYVPGTGPCSPGDRQALGTDPFWDPVRMKA